MRLKNDFSWSFSRANTFEECQKKYWYTYYGAWEGWPKTPYDSRPSIDPLASHLYMLKNMQSMPTFIGTVVHSTIEHFLKKRMAIEKDTLMHHAELAFEKGLVEAKEGTWKKSPKKHTNLFEFYHGPGVSDEAIEHAKQKIATSLENWYASSIVQSLLFHKAASIHSIEELSFFQLQNAFKIIVVIDLALFWKNSDGTKTAILFDWKTGKETEKTENQLYLYAIFAHSVWKIPYDKIILSPFYLFDNAYYKIGAKQDKTLDLDKVKKTEDEVFDSCKKLSTYHPTPENKTSVEQFSYTNAREKCRTCPFKAVCEGAQYEAKGAEELRELVAEKLGSRS
jgi:CRISPR/Cas system-associated exonuclease Cas4 (RecB family)